MKVRVGDTLPDVPLQLMKNGVVAQISAADLCRGRYAVLFAVPGAFFPACSTRHLPGFVEYAPMFAAKGVDLIGCISVNDVFVMAAWGLRNSVDTEVTLLADGNRQFTDAVGLVQDATAAGMGLRSQRYALVARNAVITHMMVEEPGSFEVSAAPAVLAWL